MSQKLLAKLKTSLVTEDNSLNRKAWAKRLVKEKVDLTQWLHLLEGKGKLAKRFLWLLGDVADVSPTVIRAVIPLVFAQRDAYQIPGVHRSLAKWMRTAGVPEAMEGEAFDVLMDWVQHPKTSKACRFYTLGVLATYAAKYPAIAAELCIVVEDTLTFGSATYQRRAHQFLKQFR